MNLKDSDLGNSYKRGECSIYQTCLHSFHGVLLLLEIRNSLLI